MFFLIERSSSRSLPVLLLLLLLFLLLLFMLIMMLMLLLLLLPLMLLMLYKLLSPELFTLFISELVLDSTASRHSLPVCRASVLHAAAAAAAAATVLFGNRLYPGGGIFELRRLRSVIIGFKRNLGEQRQRESLRDRQQDPFTEDELVMNGASSSSSRESSSTKSRRRRETQIKATSTNSMSSKPQHFTQKPTTSDVMLTNKNLVLSPPQFSAVQWVSPPWMQWHVVEQLSRVSRLHDLPTSYSWPDTERHSAV